MPSTCHQSLSSTICFPPYVPGNIHYIFNLKIIVIIASNVNNKQKKNFIMKTHCETVLSY